jgi:hypothetical protein
MFQIRISDDKSFYYLLSIDENGNEEVLQEHADIEVIYKNKKLGGKKIDPITEAEAANINSGRLKEGS